MLAPQPIESVWAAAATTEPLSETETEIRAAIRTRVHDPDQLLSTQQSERLALTLSEQLLARSALNPDAYLSLIERTPGIRWLDPGDDQQWLPIEGVFLDGVHRPFDRTRPRDALRELIRFVHETKKGRLVSAGTGERGASIEVYRVRAEDQVLLVHSQRLPDNDENGYWLRGRYSTSALRFHLPRRPLHAVLENEGSATIAATFVLVTTESGETYNWYCYWYWDARSGSWQCHTVTRKGRLGFTYF